MSNAQILQEALQLSPKERYMVVLLCSILSN